MPWGCRWGGASILPVMGRRSLNPSEMAADEMKGFAQRLKALRERRQLSQQALAEIVGLHLSQLSRLERGVSRPNAETVLALAHALRATTDALLSGDTAGEQPLEIDNLRLYERFRALGTLGREDQETVVRLIDAVIAKHRLEDLANQIKRSA